jgi:hypothetical protein
MEKITALEFLKMIGKNPSIFKTWEPPLEITTFVDCKNSPITHLPKHLIFSGKSLDIWSANFYRCPNLQIATGTFYGFVNFRESGIQKIENLQIHNPNRFGDYADFTTCSKLHNIQNWNLSKRILIEPKKLEAEKKRRASLQKFLQETQPETLPFL